MALFQLEKRPTATELSSHYFALASLSSFVISVLLISVLVGLAVFHWQTQQALRWWFEQQHQWLCREAEQVRNGPLQETFVMRRQLEMNPNETLGKPLSQHPTWMAQVTQLNGQLVRLSDELSPPYLETSLPLAIQAWAQEAELPGMPGMLGMPGVPGLMLCLPNCWHPEPPARVSLILSMLTYLMRLSMETADLPTAMSLALSQQAGWGGRGVGVLEVRLDYATTAIAAAVGRSLNLQPLIRTFQVLAPGRCTQRQRQQRLIWQFRWRLLPDSSAP